MGKTVISEARLRERNQLTIPEAIVTAAGIETGEVFVVELSSTDPDALVLRRVRPSYAGALRGLYGDPHAYLEGERGSWE
jgi:bifunctional DNA-binding transcriptional regulator/antitoxin component of YhaV-PrlF toxin-antitoxin module